MPDIVEEKIGTDPTKQDTDADYLSDLIEFLSGTSPTSHNERSTGRTSAKEPVNISSPSVSEDSDTAEKEDDTQATDKQQKETKTTDATMHGSAEDDTSSSLRSLLAPYVDVPEEQYICASKETIYHTIRFVDIIGHEGEEAIERLRKNCILKGRSNGLKE